MTSELAKGMEDLKSVIDRLLGSEEECEDCGHGLHYHADRYGCQFEGPDQFVEGESMGAWMSRGPCGCMKHREVWQAKIEAKLKQGSK